MNLNRIGLLIFLLSLLLQGCGTTEPMKRGKLSDAMGKASNTHKGARTVDPVPDETAMQDSHQQHVMSDSSQNTVASTHAQDDEEMTPGRRFGSIGLSYGKGLIEGKKYLTHDSYQLSVGSTEAGKWRHALLLGTESIRVNPSSSLYDSVRPNLRVFSFLIKGEYSFFSQAAPVRPYLMLGAGGAHMIWRYNNGISTYDGATIYFDGVSGLTLQTGVGVSATMMRFLRISAEFTPRVHLWSDTTSEDFDNDYFGATPQAEGNVNLSVIF